MYDNNNNFHPQFYIFYILDYEFYFLFLDLNLKKYFLINLVDVDNVIHLKILTFYY